MGCLFLILIALVPRAGVVALWIWTDWVSRAFDSGWVLPVLGIVIVPWTTALYVVGYIIGDGAAPWGIVGAVIGALIDIAIYTRTSTEGRRRYAS